MIRYAGMKPLAAVSSLAILLAISGACSETSPTAPIAPVPAPAALSRPPVSAPSTHSYTADVTLSGVVYERTETGSKPLQGASIYCDACGEYGHTRVSTDESGSYTFTGMWLLPFSAVPLHLEKDGYDDPLGLPAPKSPFAGKGAGWREVMISSAETHFDMYLIRRQ